MCTFLHNEYYWCHLLQFDNSNIFVIAIGGASSTHIILNNLRNAIITPLQGRRVVAIYPNIIVVGNFKQW